MGMYSLSSVVEKDLSIINSKKLDHSNTIKLASGRKIGIKVEMV